MVVYPWQSRHPGLQRTMSSYDKVVKLACKPKAAPPKSKVTFTLWPWQCFSSNIIIVPVYWPYYSRYLVRGRRYPRCVQSLISSHSRAQYHCALYWIIHLALSQPVLQIVFKALIVLHMMIRNGATDNVLSYLSSSEVLRLRDISHGNWEGQLESILTFDDIWFKVLQVTQHLKIYKSMLSIWIPGSAHTKISNMMLSRCRMNLIETDEHLPRSKKIGTLVRRTVPRNRLLPPCLLGVKQSWVENCGQWQWKRACCEKQKSYTAWLTLWWNAGCVHNDSLFFVLVTYLHFSYQVLLGRFGRWINYHCPTYVG